MIAEVAPAKINLYLHVGGVRDDRLHELASLFVFTTDGDEITASIADQLSLNITGPFAHALSEFPVTDNLVFQAAQNLKQLVGVNKGAALKLNKNLPVAAGIGGGSADAAAALRALIKLWDIDISGEELTKLAFSLGADVPACLSKNPVFVSGAGESIETAHCVPPLWVCLINPRVETPTGPIFQAFDVDNPTPAVPVQMDVSIEENVTAFFEALQATSNDLEAAAAKFLPAINDVTAYLRSQKGCLLARMSGSGATCFGLFENREQAAAAATNALETGWWALATNIA